MPSTTSWRDVQAASWHQRKALRSLACGALGRTEEERRAAFDVTRLEFQKKWLEAEDPSYLLPEYASEWYAFACVECFSDYTAKSVRSFAGWWGDRPGTVLDLGAGIGASTRLLEELTNAEVVYHAYSFGAQLTVAREVVGPSTLLISEDEASVLGSVHPNAVMAFELFEHVRNPIALLHAIDEAGVDVLCCANSFGALDFGHWKTYLVNGEEVPREKMGIRFGRALKTMGWQLEWAGWNARPAVWTRRQPRLS